MANPTISISGFSLLPERLQAGTPFTATITAKNNLGATALYAYLTAHIDMEGLDAGDPGAGRVNLYSSGVQQISIANGASKALTFSGTISETAWDELNAILEKYPSAPIRRNAIIWSLHMDNGGFEYSADTIYNAGELLDAFYSPAIEAFRLERCMDGVPNDEGESLLSTIKLGLAEKARQALLSLKLYYSESAPAVADSDFIDLSSSIPDLIGGITDSAELIAQTFGNTANWNFLLVFGDEYESAVAAFSLSRAFANMHLSGATTGGVAFGGFSTSGEGDPKLESHYPAYLYGGAYGTLNETIQLTGASFSTAANVEKIVPFNAALSIGGSNRLRFSDNSVVIGAGVKAIEVSAHITFTVYYHNGPTVIYIKKNGAQVGVLTHHQLFASSSTGTWVSIQLNPAVIEVNEGDVITLYIKSNAAISSMASQALLVKMLE